MDNDEKVAQLLKSFKPKSAPASMDASVLEAAGSAAGKLAARRTRRLLLLTGASAAAILIFAISALLWLPGGSEDTGLQPETTSIIAKCDKVSARAKLLRAKLERLRKLALYSKNRTRHLSNLDNLKKELDAINSLCKKEKLKPVKKPDGQSLTPAKGEKYAQEGSCTNGRLCLGDWTRRDCRG